MGSILSSIKKGLKSLRECQATVKSMRRDIKAIRRCIDNVCSIVEDFELVSKEVKNTVDICTDKWRKDLYEEIYSSLTTKEKESLFHVAFYDEIIKDIAKMKGEVKICKAGCSEGDMHSYIFNNIQELLMERKIEYAEDEEKIGLIDALYSHIDEDVSIKEYETSDEGSRANYTYNGKEAEKRITSNYAHLTESHGEEFIEMKSMRIQDDEERSKTPMEMHKKSMCSAPWGIKKLGAPDSNETCDIIRLFCLWQRFEYELMRKIKEHLRVTDFEEFLPMNVSIIERIITEDGDIFLEVPSQNCYIKKIRCLLTNSINYRKFGVINVRINPKKDVDWNLCANRVEDAAGKVHLFRDDIIEKVGLARGMILNDQQDDVYEDIWEQKDDFLDQNNILLKLADVLRGKEKEYTIQALSTTIAKLIQKTVDEKQTEEMLYETMTWSIDILDKYKSIAKENEAAKVVQFVKGLDQIITVVFEEIRKAKICLDVGKTNADGTQLSKNIVSTVAKTVIENIPGNEENLLQIKKTSSLSDTGPALKSDMIKALMQIISDVILSNCIDNTKAVNTTKMFLKNMQIPRRYEDLLIPVLQKKSEIENLQKTLLSRICF